MIRPPKFLTGNSELTQWLNQLLRFVISQKAINSPTVTIKEGPNGVSYHAETGGGASSPIACKTFHFKQSLGDYFLTQEGTAVAKPYKLRCSIASETIYGVKVNFSYPHNPSGGGPSADPLAYLYRVASVANGSTSENEGISPQYLVGDPILCIQPSDGTGVTSDPLDTSMPMGTKITWMQDGGAHAWIRFANQTF